MTKPKKQTKRRRGQYASKAMLGVVATHGFAVTDSDDVVSRAVHIRLLSDGKWQLIIETVSKDSPTQIITNIVFGDVLFQQIQRAFFEAHDIHKWKYT